PLLLYLSYPPPSTSPLHTLSLHDALPISRSERAGAWRIFIGGNYNFLANHPLVVREIERVNLQVLAFDIGESDAHTIALHDGTKDRKSTRLNSSHVSISYAVFCLKKKTTQ